MKRMRSVWVATALLLMSACTDPNAEANKHFVKALELEQKAQAEADPKAKITLLAGADELLAKIVKDYPSATLAVQLSSGQSVGRISMDGVREQRKVAQRQYDDAHCMEEPTPRCMLWLAVGIAEEERDNLFVFAETSYLFARLGETAALRELHSRFPDVEKWGDHDQFYVRWFASNQIKAGNADLAAPFLKRLEHRYGADAATDLVQLYAELGEFNQALSWLRRVNKGDLFSAELALFDVHMKNGDRASASAALNRAEAASDAGSDSNRQRAAEAYCDLGATEKCNNLLAKLSEDVVFSPSAEPRDVVGLLRLSVQGKFEPKRDLLAEVRDPLWRVYGLGVIARAAHDKGDAVEARARLDEAFSIASTEWPAGGRTRALLSVAQVDAKVGVRRSWAALIAEEKAATGSIENLDDRAEGLAQLALIQQLSGDQAGFSASMREAVATARPQRAFTMLWIANYWVDILKPEA